jgi:CHASE3 domain sensor protein
MRNQNFIKTVIWVVVIGMVLTMIVASLSILL